jgi:ribosomal protein L18
VFRTNLHIYASVISDDGGACWPGLDRREGSARATGRGGQGRQRRRRRLIGKRIAEKAKAAGIEKVAFDRSGFAYHGRVKAWPKPPAKPACSSEPRRHRRNTSKWQSSLPARRPKATTTA